MNETSSVVEVVDIESPYLLNTETVHQFRMSGFNPLKNVFNTVTLKAYEREISECVKAKTPSNRKIPAARSTYERAFVQVVNLWRQTSLVKEFVFGRKLARIAYELLGVSRIRLYHDQALYKKPGGGFTPWHADRLLLVP